MLKQKLWIGISALLVLIGMAGMINIFLHGEHVMGTTNYVPWGSLIGAYVFFVATSTGLTFISSLAHTFKVHKFDVLTKRMTLASIATLLMGFVMIGIELGNPLAMVYIILSPNFTAPIFWMGLLYSFYLALHVVEFYFQLKGDHKKINVISPIVLAVAVAAQSTLGAVFGMAVARGYWNDAYISIYFILLAFISGLAFVSIMMFLMSKADVISKKTKDQISQLHPVMSKMILGLLAAAVFFNVWKWIYTLSGNVPGQADAAMLMAGGALTLPYWLLEVGFVFVVPIVLLLTLKKQQGLALMLSGLSMLIGIFAMRMIMVFAGQAIPLNIIPGAESATGLREFSITWSEWATFGFGVGGTILIYILGEKLFNLNLEDDHHTESEKSGEKMTNTGYKYAR